MVGKFLPLFQLNVPVVIRAKVTKYKQTNHQRSKVSEDCSSLPPCLLITISKLVSENLPFHNSMPHSVSTYKGEREERGGGSAIPDTVTYELTTQYHWTCFISITIHVCTLPVGVCALHHETLATRH